MNDGTTPNPSPRCFMCRTELKADGTFVYGAAIFSASGNYGSAVWDAVGRNLRLELYVCDGCLTSEPFAELATGRVRREKTEVVSLVIPVKQALCLDDGDLADPEL